MSRVIKALSCVRSDAGVVLARKDPTSDGGNPAAQNPDTPSGEDAETRNAVADAAELRAQAERLAAERLAAAEAEAAARLAEAEQRIARWWEERRREDEALREHVRQEAYEAGYAQGLAEGREAARREWEAALRKARETVALAQQEKARVIAEAEPFLVELAVAIAEKLIGEHLALAPETVLTVVRNALKRSRERTEVAVYVHPDDYPIVLDGRPLLADALSPQTELVVYPDEAVKRGGCLVKTSLGTIDARLDHQLEAVRQALMAVAKERAPEGSDDVVETVS